MYAKLSSCATLEKKKKTTPIQWLGLLKTDRYSSHQTFDLQQLFARLIVLH